MRIIDRRIVNRTDINGIAFHIGGGGFAGGLFGSRLSMTIYIGGKLMAAVPVDRDQPVSLESIDEWIDGTVAAAKSHAVKKFAKDLSLV